MEFLEKTGPRPCPVKGCRDRLVTRMDMMVYFWQGHVQDTMVIL